VDMLVDSRARMVDVYAGHFVSEHRRAIQERGRDIWMTKMDPADIYVLYPGEGFERHLSSAFFIRMEGAELGVKEDGVIILALSAAGGWAPDQSSGHGREMTPEQVRDLFKAGTEEMARQMVRRAVNVRTVSSIYTARRVLEQRKVILACDGISPQEAAEYGFAHCTTSFDEAMAMALADRGQDAQIAVNRVSAPINHPPGRPVAWRAMPWREG
jgi:nickel-dependent lactate racemase